MDRDEATRARAEARHGTGVAMPPGAEDSAATPAEPTGGRGDAAVRAGRARGDAPPEGPSTGFGGSAPAPPESYRARGRAAADAREATIELREEQLVARKEMRELGEVEIRTRTEEVPGRLEVEALREEVEVEHVPVGQVVQERASPYEKDGALIVPVYEEQLVVVKRLVHREDLVVRRVPTSERRLIEEMLKRERIDVTDPTNQGLVHERYPETDSLGVTADGTGKPAAMDEPRFTPADASAPTDGGFLGRLSGNKL